MKPGPFTARGSWPISVLEAGTGSQEEAPSFPSHNIRRGRSKMPRAIRDTPKPRPAAAAKLPWPASSCPPHHHLHPQIHRVLRAAKATCPERPHPLLWRGCRRPLPRLPRDSRTYQATLFVLRTVPVGAQGGLGPWATEHMSCYLLSCPTLLLVPPPAAAHKGWAMPASPRAPEGSSVHLPLLTSPPQVAPSPASQQQRDSWRPISSKGSKKSAALCLGGEGYASNTLAIHL